MELSKCLEKLNRNSDVKRLEAGVFIFDLRCHDNQQLVPYEKQI